MRRCLWLLKTEAFGQQTTTAVLPDPSIEAHVQEWAKFLSPFSHRGKSVRQYTCSIRYPSHSRFRIFPYLVRSSASLMAVVSTEAGPSSPPPRKRVRVDHEGPQQTEQPRLYAPFRALGMITNAVPFVMQTRSHKGATDGPRIHLVTCLGRSWAMWEGGKMGLLFVGAYQATS